MLIIIGEREGNPGSFELYSLKNAEEPVLSLDIDGVRLAREYGAHVKGQSNVITFSADSNKTSISLRQLFESYFDKETYSTNSYAKDVVRVLSIVGMGEERVRLTFKDSNTRLDLGPSITGSLKKR